MERAAEIGAVLLPPVPAFYARPQTIDDVVDNTVGRVLLRLGIENELYLKWAGMRKT
jgi:3-polyprenyl-4-hydroxybenzoate decarboxylase